MSKIVRELTPELADKIYKSVQKKRYDEQVAKEYVLHHLKQLKAQMGKMKNGYGDKYNMQAYRKALYDVSIVIDKKIAKINGQSKTVRTTK